MIRKFTVPAHLLLIAVGVLSLLANSGMSFAAPGGQEEWERVLLAAKSEGKLSLIGPLGADRDLGNVVPFASVRIQDPVGVHIDISQEGAPNVREGYTEERWDQPRHFNHIALRAIEPALLAEFYKEVFELQAVETAKDHVCLSDGKNYLIIRPCHTSSYATMQEGLDHIGFKVEDLAKAKNDLDDIAVTAPQSAPKKVAGRRFGDITLKDLEACAAGKYETADPDGVLLHLAE